MVDYLANLARRAAERVGRGYYSDIKLGKQSTASLVETIQKSQSTPIITEVKFASPSAGKIREREDPLRIAREMLMGGACAISVLTDPDDFHGSLETLATLSREVDVPLIMKDIVVSLAQLQAAAMAGARAVVLISELFTRRLTDESLDKLLEEARRLGLEVLLEANTPHEFGNLQRHRPDLFGINNRNLSTFKLDLSTTERVLASNGHLDRPIVSESGIKDSADVLRLRKTGVNAFLVGTSIMSSSDIEAKVRELVEA
jgi:indole-3-glycerol phosphate synthase